MKNFSVNGYKAFNKTKEFEFAPITLLIGKNGSGKSNLINSLLLLKEVFSKRLKDEFTFEEAKQYLSFKNAKYYQLTGDYCFNSIIINPFSFDGFFSSETINENKNNTKFELSFPLPLAYFDDNFSLKIQYEIIDSKQDDHGTAKLVAISVTSNSNHIDLVNISVKKKQKTKIKINTNYVYTFMNKLVEKYKNLNPNDDGSRTSQAKYSEAWNSMKKESGKDGLIKRLKTNFYNSELNLELKNYNCFGDKENSTLISLYKEYIELIDDKEINNLDIENFNRQKIFIRELNNDGVFGNYGITETINGLIGNENTYFNSFGLPESVISFDYQTKEEVLDFNPSKELEFILHKLLLKNIGSTLNNVVQQINDFKYIPPLRSSSYRSSDALTNNQFTKSVNEKIIQILNKDTYRKPFLDFFNNWIVALELPKKYKLNNLRELIEMLSFKNDLLGNSGYGINQLIPLLSFISFFNTNFSVSEFDADISFGEAIEDSSSTPNVFLIEEPEANLHPSYQSKLADIFIDSAWKFGHNFIIETHSEYMVRKIQYWVAKGKIKPSDINIYYFDNQNENPDIKDVVIKKISINKDGSLSEPFGEGFFDEAIGLRLELLKLKSLN